MDAINGSMATLKSDLTTLRPLIKSLKENALNAYATESLSNQAIASFTDGANNVPVKSLSVAITPVQSGTGDPSPDNIRPITGRTGAKVTRTAENLFGGNLMRDGVLASMASATDDATNRCVTFAASAAATQRITGASGIEGKFKENTRYTFIMTIYKSAGVGANLRINYTDGTYTGITGYTAGEKKTVLVVSDANKTVFSFSKQYVGGASTLYYDESGIFEGVLTAADFKAYEGTTYTISWQTEAGTVYGGTLNVLTGKLNAYPYYASYNGETLTGEWICDRAVYAAGVTPPTGSQVVDMGGSTTEYDLTPTEVTTLLGENNVWADTGDITEITIRCDTALYIAKLMG